MKFLRICPPALIVTIYLAGTLNAGARRNFSERHRNPPETVAAVPWAVTNAPFRALLQLDTPPNVPAAGVAIELPDFGHTKPDLSDVVLTDAKGTIQPMNAMWLRPSGTALLLAKDLKQHETYALYFGGGISRERKPWGPPAMSLLMETRRLAGGAKFGNWREMLDTWERSGPADGMGFVRQIFHGENPFGESHRFATHYTGYLLTQNVRQMRLYTLSSDASFVLVNGQCVLSAPGTHGARANEKTATMATIMCKTPLTRIDYYHVKAESEHNPSMVLGWQDELPVTRREQRYHGYEAIPSTAWAHSGSARIVRFEGRNGHPVPALQERISSYIGYGGAWFYDLLLTTPPLPEGWTAEWEFADGLIRNGATASRILITDAPQKITLRLKHDSEILTGVHRLEFRNDLPQASINRPTDAKRYAALLSQDDFAKLPAVAFAFLKEFGTHEHWWRLDGGARRWPNWIRSRPSILKTPTRSNWISSGRTPSSPPVNPMSRANSGPTSPRITQNTNVRPRLVNLPSNHKNSSRNLPPRC